MNQRVFIAIAVLVGAAGLMMPQAVANPYYFYAGYIVLQYVVAATGWNILGGYAATSLSGPPRFSAQESTRRPSCSRRSARLSSSRSWARASPA